MQTKIPTEIAELLKQLGVLRSTEIKIEISCPDSATPDQIIKALINAAGKMVKRRNAEEGLAAIYLAILGANEGEEEMVIAALEEQIDELKSAIAAREDADDMPETDEDADEDASNPMKELAKALGPVVAMALMARMAKKRG